MLHLLLQIRLRLSELPCKLTSRIFDNRRGKVWMKQKCSNITTRVGTAGKIKSLAKLYMCYLAGEKRECEMGVKKV